MEIKPIKEYALEEILNFTDDDINALSKQARNSLNHQVAVEYLKLSFGMKPNEKMPDYVMAKIQKPDPEVQCHFMDVEKFDGLSQGTDIYFFNYVNGSIMKGHVGSMRLYPLGQKKMPYGNSIYYFPKECLEIFAPIDPPALAKIKELSTDRRLINPDQIGIFESAAPSKTTIIVDWESGEITVTKDS